MLFHLRSAARRLVRDRTFAVLGALTLALAIGACGAIFTLVDNVVLQPLPFDEPERLVYVGHTAPGLDLPRLNMTDRLYLHYAEHAESFEHIGLYDCGPAPITGLDRPQHVGSCEMSPSVLTILRVAPALGRPFTAEEETPGAAPVVLISDSFWRRQLGGAPDVLDRTLEVGGEVRQVVGVMAPDFAFPDENAEIWMPFVVDPETASLGTFGIEGIARLAEGRTLSQAEAELRRFTSDLEGTFPDNQRVAQVLQSGGFDVTLQTYHESLVGPLGPILWVLSATVGFVLLLAALNVANLFLARAEERTRETALRTALGAGPGQLAATALFEGWFLSFAAAGLGLGLAAGGIRLVRRLGPQGMPRIHEVGLDLRSVAFVVSLALVCGAAFSLIPILRSRIHDLAGHLKDGGRSSTAGTSRHRARRLLVAGQTCIALVLLVGAALMGRSYLEITRVDPGFDTHGALSFRLTLPESSVEGERVAGVYARLLEEISAVPGVASVASGRSLPLTGRNSGSGHHFADDEVVEGLLPVVLNTNSVSHGFFETMGMRMLEGRALERADWESSRMVLVISETLARTRWPGESALGKRMAPGRTDEGHWFEVVGVVADVKNERLTDEPSGTVFYPMRNEFPGMEEAPRGQSFVIRARDGVDPGSLLEPARAAVWSVDPNLPLAEVQTFDEVLANARRQSAFTAIMLLLAAVVALVLGAVGTYGVIAYLVAQRTGEIGVRLALGARPGQVLGLVLREGLMISVAGVAVGLVAAFGLVRWLDSILFEVDPSDPLTFVVVPLVLLAIATLACLVPALRAARTEPTVALRHD